MLWHLCAYTYTPTSHPPISYIHVTHNMSYIHITPPPYRNNQKSYTHPHHTQRLHRPTSHTSISHPHVTHLHHTRHTYPCHTHPCQTYPPYTSPRHTHTHIPSNKQEIKYYIEIWSYCIALVNVELGMDMRLALILQRSDCFCRPSAEIKGVLATPK